MASSKVNIKGSLMFFHDIGASGDTPATKARTKDSLISNGLSTSNILEINPTDSFSTSNTAGVKSTGQGVSILGTPVSFKVLAINHTGFQDSDKTIAASNEISITDESDNIITKVYPGMTFFLYDGNSGNIRYNIPTNPVYIIAKTVS